MTGPELLRARGWRCKTMHVLHSWEQREMWEHPQQPELYHSFESAIVSEAWFLMNQRQACCCGANDRPRQPDTRHTRQLSCTKAERDFLDTVREHGLGPGVGECQAAWTLVVEEPRPSAAHLPNDGRPGGRCGIRTSGDHWCTLYHGHAGECSTPCPCGDEGATWHPVGHCMGRG
jgi:hypothetical protein